MSNKDDFVMLPTNDFCFKELMQNPKVRKGFIAGILRKDPKEIKEIILLLGINGLCSIWLKCTLDKYNEVMDTIN